MKNTQDNKQLLNLAGEFRVASELLKRGVYCSVTYGNKKGVDIIIYDESSSKYLIVEVKTSSSNRFVTSFYQKYKTENMSHPDYWVLFSLIKTESGFEEHFYILTHKELAQIQAERNNSTNKSWEERVSNGVDNVLAKQLDFYENKWDTILKNNQ